MLLIYAIISIGLQIIFWRVELIAVGAVTISIMRSLLGPMFGTAVSVYLQNQALRHQRKATASQQERV